MERKTPPRAHTLSNAAKNIPLEKIIEHARQGLNHSEIARLLGCHRANIAQRLQRANVDVDGVTDYVAARGTILHALHEKIIRAITDEKIAKMSAYQLTGMSAIIFNQAQIAEQRPTQIQQTVTAFITKSWDNLLEKPKQIDVEVQDVVPSAAQVK